MTGTEIYARSIIEALAASEAQHRLRVYANASASPSWLPAGVEWRGIPFPRAWTHSRFRQALRRDRPDLVFIPSHVLPLALGLRSVVTIHDVGHRREAASYSRTDWLYLELTTRYAARNASALIAVSQSTADDLRRFYHVAPGKVTVIHSGVDAGMRPPSLARIAEVRQKFAIGEPYFLFLGRNHPRKNLPLLRRAFLEARRQGLRASLVVAGPGHQQVDAHDAGIILLPYVAGEDLPALYAGAIALTLPSRFEGFGFPALEAMRCGTAVIASTAGSLPEIVGSAGVLLSADDAPGWTSALLQLSQDAGRRERLIEAGLAHSARFTWESAAARTWTVLDRAARSDD